jgi:hypothetical protein
VPCGGALCSRGQVVKHEIAVIAIDDLEDANVRKNNNDASPVSLLLPYFFTTICETNNLLTVERFQVFPPKL